MMHRSTHEGLTHAHRALAGALLAGVLLTGCAASSSDEAAIPGSAAGSDSGTTEQYAADAAASEEYASDTAAAVDTQAVITTGWATVITGDPAASAAAFRTSVTAMGGRVDSSWSSSAEDSSRPTTELTVRVPADSFQELLDSLADLGKVTDQSTNAQDVTQQITDLDARIAALETSIERLTELMEQATTTEDLLSAEEMLTQRQAELDSLTAQLEYLRDQVTMSTLTVTFTTRESSGGPSFSWAEAWENLLYSLYSMVNFLVIALPWLVVALVVFFAVRWLVRRRRRRRSQTPAASPVPDSDDDAPEALAH